MRGGEVRRIEPPRARTQYQTIWHASNWSPRSRRKRNEVEIDEVKMAKDFWKINETDSRIPENLKQDLKNYVTNVKTHLNTS